MAELSILPDFYTLSAKHFARKSVGLHCTQLARSALWSHGFGMQAEAQHKDSRGGGMMHINTPTNATSAHIAHY